MYQIHTLYTLHLRNVICQLHFNKARKKLNKQITLVQGKEKHLLSVYSMPGMGLGAG